MRATQRTPLVLTFLALGAVAMSTVLGGGQDHTKPQGPAADRARPHNAVPDPPLDRQEAISNDPFFQIESKAEMREWLAFTGSALRSDTARLRALALQSKQALVAGNAIRALGRLRKVAGDPELLRLLNDKRQRVRQELAMALGISGDRTLVPDLIARLRVEDAALRPLLIEALGRLGGKEAAAVLTSLTTDTDCPPTDRAFARQALRRIGF